jgi:hypothetical protein
MMRGLKSCMIVVAALGGLAAARGADLRCDTPGVAQLVALHSNFDRLGPAVRLAPAGVSDQ